MKGAKTVFSLSKREFCDGERKMVSVRLPVTLSKEIEKIAGNYGWTSTDIIVTALDQFAQWAKAQKSK
jgi:hypothetical protein